MNNKYKVISVLLFCFSIIMTIGITVYLLIGYQNYLKHPEVSAPYSVKVILVGVTYGIPIVIGFVLSIIFKRKAKKH